MATETLPEQMAKALKAREAGLTPEQRKLREETDARNAAIQAAPLRAKDGVTFGKQHKDKR